MEVNSAIDIAVYDGVYAPAEDSYLLLDAVEADGRMLDMGAGTGIVGLHAAMAGADVVAVDVDARAVDNARCNAACNHLDMEVVQSDLFANVQGCYDVIMFNPPYLPAEDSDARWDGGPGGVAVARRFLREADGYLGEDGRVYLLLSSLGDVSGLLREFQGRYVFREIRRLSLFFERLLVYEVRRKNSGRVPTA
ncbi:MAG: HemK2/MTQ2 family protein methyltransferase [Thermoplasmatota archaeon]